jgi:hypothetical protein
VRRHITRIVIAGILAVCGTAAASQSSPRLQSAEEALTQDAAEYARMRSVTLEEAKRRLRAQENSVAVTERLRAALRHRLAGISIEHHPQYRIVVLLTGIAPLANQAELAAGSPLPIVFQLGAGATRDQLVAAMRRHQPRLRSELPNARGMGLDPRTGELVLLVTPGDADRLDIGAIDQRAENLTGVPVRVEVVNRPDSNMARGGGRVEGTDPSDGRRYACTTGFVVKKGARTGILTAAHCPNELVYREANGERLPLEFVGQWGVATRDVQIHLSDGDDEPVFYADRSAAKLRPLTGWRSRESTRAGEWLCHWGESSGYSCSEVALTNYAPPGDLCGGPCEPVWVTVTGPSCKAGDSGGPVFAGTTAFGIAKGGSGLRTRCNFYYYMSTDFIPDGWSLLGEPEALAERKGAAARAAD